MNMSTGHLVKVYRIIRGLRQHELAAQVGFHRSSLSRIETGLRKINDAERRRIAKVLKCDESELR